MHQQSKDVVDFFDHCNKKTKTNTHLLYMHIMCVIMYMYIYMHKMYGPKQSCDCLECIGN